VSFRRLHRWLLGSLVGASALAALASVYVEWRFSARIRTIANVPHAPIALVFGAGLASGGEPSKMLAERINTAIQLYRAGKVDKLLLSGDNSERYHDETRAMGRYALDQGLAPKALLRDVAGISTYDSCYRAKQLFGVRKAILVTQAFHLPRALFIANSLGIDAYGIAAQPLAKNHPLDVVREFFARPLALARVTWGLRPKIPGQQPELPENQTPPEEFLGGRLDSKELK
jgi:SanA protein